MGRWTTLTFRNMIFLMSSFGVTGLLLVSIITIREPEILATTETTLQNPGEITGMMTQASEDIQNELASQADKLRNQLINTFGFNEIQSQLSLGYQSAFAGNTSGAISHVERANEALEKTIVSIFRTGEEVTRISQNNSMTLDNDTRQILAAVGSGLAELGAEVREQRTNLVGMF